MKKSLLFIAVLFVLTGCQKESLLPETTSTPQLMDRVRLNKGITEYTVEFEGTTRKYTVNTPLNYNRRKTYPLVLVLKGKKGTTERLITSMNDLINTRQYIAVYAEAVYSEGWNVGANEVDQLADVRFIESVISTLTSPHRITVFPMKEAILIVMSSIPPNKLLRYGLSTMAAMRLLS